MFERLIESLAQQANNIPVNIAEQFGKIRPTDGEIIAGGTLGGILLIGALTLFVNFLDSGESHNPGKK